MNTMNKWPDWADDIWAKSPNIDQQTGETLALKLYIHQQKSLNVVRSAILIAPTGSGKTEAAFLWAAKQIEQKKYHEYLYVTIPG